MLLDYSTKLVRDWIKWLNLMYSDCRSALVYTVQAFPSQTLPTLAGLPTLAVAYLLNSV